MPIKIEKVLLVDDDAAVRLVAEIILSRIGKLNVRLASSGIQALEILESFKPDLILLDVMMPVLDGPGVLRVLKSKPALAGIPVVYMTADVQMRENLQYGISGVIIKPFDLVSLPKELNSIVNSRLEPTNVA